MDHDNQHERHRRNAVPAESAPQKSISPTPSLRRTAFSATVHCLTGCAIGEVLGMVIGTALRWSNPATVAISIVLAFDTISITIMEIVDNAIMLVIPGAMQAGLGSPLFWLSLALALIIAGAAAFPVNWWLIARGRGHAVVHAYHRAGHRRSQRDP